MRSSRPLLTLLLRALFLLLPAVPRQASSSETSFPCRWFFPRPAVCICSFRPALSAISGSLVLLLLRFQFQFRHTVLLLPVGHSRSSETIPRRVFGRLARFQDLPRTPSPDLRSAPATASRTLCSIYTFSSLCPTCAQ